MRSVAGQDQLDATSTSCRSIPGGRQGDHAAGRFELSTPRSLLVLLDSMTSVVVLVEDAGGELKFLNLGG